MQNLQLDAATFAQVKRSHEALVKSINDFQLIAGQTHNGNDARSPKHAVQCEGIRIKCIALQRIFGAQTPAGLAATYANVAAESEEVIIADLPEGFDPIVATEQQVLKLAEMVRLMRDVLYVIDPRLTRDRLDDLIAILTA